MSITDRQYLEAVLRTKKMEFDECVIANRISIAEYMVRKTMFYDQINSLEKQLDSSKTENRGA